MAGDNISRIFYVEFIKSSLENLVGGIRNEWCYEKHFGIFPKNLQKRHRNETFVDRQGEVARGFFPRFILWINPNTVRINGFILTVMHGYAYYKLIYGKHN